MADPKMMSALYDVTPQNIGQHIKRIFDDGELSPDSVIKKFFITAPDGKDYSTMHYNLQMVIAVGFKVNNERAVRFRKWAGQIVKDYTIQGWLMDADRLKKGHMFTDEYFERQLQQIREIRLSERKFYQKVIDIYAKLLTVPFFGRILQGSPPLLLVSLQKFYSIKPSISSYNLDLEGFSVTTNKLYFEQNY